MKYQSIIVRAYSTFADCETTAGCVVEFAFDTIKEAKQRAKYYLTEAYRHSSESAACLQYAQVLADGECVADYFGN